MFDAAQTAGRSNKSKGFGCIFFFFFNFCFCWFHLFFVFHDCALWKLARRNFLLRLPYVNMQNKSKRKQQTEMNGFTIYFKWLIVSLLFLSFSLPMVCYNWKLHRFDIFNYHNLTWFSMLMRFDEWRQWKKSGFLF